MTATQRAAIYTRVSSQHQKDDGTSLETQHARCTAYSAEHGYEVIGSYTDTHTGAQYRERAGLTQLRALVRADNVDVVICHALDRLSRDQTHTAVLVDELEHHGARLELVTESFEDSAVGKFIRSAKSFASEVEREKLVERVSRGRRARAEAGKYLPGRKPPYGYRLTTDHARLEIDDVEAASVRRIFADYLGGGTLRGIAKTLTDDGVPTPEQARTGNPVWGMTTVRRILSNPTYTGTKLSHHGTITLENIAPAIIDQATLDAVQRRLSTNRQHARRNARYPDELALLRGGFAHCGICGSTMHVRGRGRGGATADYVCRSASDNQCSRHTIRTHLLDEAVWSRLRRWMLDDEPLTRTQDGRVVAADPGPELAQIERSLAAIDRQRDNLTRTIGLTDDPDSVATLIGQLDQLSQRRRELTAERETVAREVEGYRLSQQLLDDLDGWRKQTAAGMDLMTYQERRELLALLGLKVQLWPADQTPRWRATSELAPSIMFSTN